MKSPLIRMMYWINQNESVKIIQFDWNRFKERLCHWDPWANRKLFNFIERQNNFTDYVTKLRMKLSHAPEGVRKINPTIWTGFIRRLVHILVGGRGVGGEVKGGGVGTELMRVVVKGLHFHGSWGTYNDPKKRNYVHEIWKNIF